MSRGSTPYPPEFRAEAVRLARQPGQSMRKVAMNLGIANESLRRWVMQADADAGVTDGLTTDERAELTRLRRENRTLRTEREILKKAAVSSTGRCNSLLESSGRSRVAERLARPGVQLERDAVEVLLAVDRKVGALGEVLSEQAIGVLVRAALPGAPRVGEVDLDIGGQGEPLVGGELHAPIPGE